MYYVYILQSERDLSFYVGHTDNLEKRLTEHNRGKNQYTQHKLPWKLVYKEVFDSRGNAMKREN